MPGAVQWRQPFSVRVNTLLNRLLDLAAKREPNIHHAGQNAAHLTLSRNLRVQALVVAATTPAMGGPGNVQWNNERLIGR
jgi:hypothetical protein